MSSRPRVSVHVVTYQQRDLVEETVESCVAQDYENLQVVVSDDGSTDGTAEVVEELARRNPDRVVALTGGPNLGISGNSNRCLAACEGELIAFVAGDDLMLPGKVRAQVDWFLRYSDGVLCAHDVEHFDSETGETLKLHSSMCPLADGWGAARFLEHGYFAATSSLMVRRDAIPEKGFDERIPIHSDFKLAVECLVGGGRFGHVDGVYGRYRIHGGNATARYREKQWEEMMVTLALLEAEYPALGPACHRSRARFHYTRGVALLQRGEVRQGKVHLATALRLAPTLSAKLPMWWLISAVPASLRSVAFAAIDRKRGATPKERR